MIEEHGFNVGTDTEEYTSFTDSDDNEYLVRWGKAGSSWYPEKIENRSGGGESNFDTLRDKIENEWSTDRNDFVDTIESHGFSVDFDSDEYTTFSDKNDNEYIVRWGNSGDTWWPEEIETQ